MPPAPDLTRRPRARIAFGDADMVRLRDLYYDTAVPMVKVAQAFGVSASTLYHWIADMDWPRRSASAPRIDARVDFRQYVVFSVTGVALQAAAQQAGVPLEEKDNTVQHNELSIGVSFKF